LVFDGDAEITETAAAGQGTVRLEARAGDHRHGHVREQRLERDRLCRVHHAAGEQDVLGGHHEVRHVAVGRIVDDVDLDRAEAHRTVVVEHHLYPPGGQIGDVNEHRDRARALADGGHDDVADVGAPGELHRRLAILVRRGVQRGEPGVPRFAAIFIPPLNDLARDGIPPAVEQQDGQRLR
jgi:hypothetical protein